MLTGEESPAKKQTELKGFLDGQTDLIICSLQSGAGIDGIQHRCRTAVFGELDWSHEQCCGRVYRDGQPDPVTAYFMLSDEGIDPMIATVLGIKTEQIDGLRGAASNPLQQVDAREGIRQLAESYLAAK